MPSTIRPQDDSCLTGELPESDSYKQWLRVGIAAVLAGQSMMFGLAANLTPPEGVAYWFVHGGLALSAIVVMVLLAPPLVRESLEALKGRRLSLESLFVISTVGALVASLVATVRQEGKIYYEVVSLLMAVYTLGKTLSARSKAKVLQRLQAYRRRYAWARRVQDDGSVERVEVDDIQLGDEVLVSPGEPICVDGVVVEGEGYVEETSMTGESFPVGKQVGDPLLAGTFSLDGAFKVKALVSGQFRKLDGVFASIEQARMQPTELQQVADRIMAWFIPLVIVLSGVTLGVWWWLADFWTALFNMMAVLLVACPCAMGLAIPIAVWSGLARLSQMGLTAKSADFMDQLSKVDRVFFDKTGTLTEAELKLKRFLVLPAFQDQQVWIEGLVKSIQSRVNHPIAKAFQRWDTRPGAPRVDVEQVRVIPGRGLQARVQDLWGTEHTVLIGERQFIFPESTTQPFQAVLEEHMIEGGKHIWISMSGKACAVAQLSESIKPGAEALFGQLESMGVRSEILTGDPSASLEMFPSVEIQRGLSPDEKKQRVEACLQSGEHCLFVGDGINDSSAMALCQVSLAMGEGAELSKTTASAILNGNDPSCLPVAMDLSKRVRRTILSNLKFAGVYNFSALTLAACGLLHPVLAALLMVGNSVLVSWRSLRQVNFNDETGSDVEVLGQQEMPGGLREAGRAKR